jgi:hypothetical protein
MDLFGLMEVELPTRPIAPWGPAAGPLEPGQTMELTYDFGDNWQFTVKLERIELPDARRKAPRILETHGKAPKQYGSWDD